MMISLWGRFALLRKSVSSITSRCSTGKHVVTRPSGAIFLVLLIILAKTRTTETSETKKLAASDLVEKSLAPEKRFVCERESHYIVTDRLSNEMSYALELPEFHSSNSSAIGWTLPRNGEMSPEEKRSFVAHVSQDLCPVLASRTRCASMRLPKVEIPQGVHAMSGSGHGFVKGGLYNGDMVFEALRSVAGSEYIRRLTDSGVVLDWGGSSGRTIAVLQAAYPRMKCHLADPIRKSMQWARQNLGRHGVVPYASPVVPPTAYRKNQFDLVFAISIWSHYNFGASNGTKSIAHAWLDEMHRILSPRGYLVITTHGWVASRSKVASPDARGKIRAALTDPSVGHWYLAAFPGNVDWDADTRNPDWGMSWVNPWWLQKEISSTWRIVGLFNGRNDCLQDVMVLSPI